MNCGQDIIKGNLEFFQRFYPKVLRDRIPVVGGIELTNRCNLNCVHCYVRDRRKKQSPEAELTTRQWLDLIDQVTKAGCLFLLFTGGETLLRPDFHVIYSHACMNGLLATVFTNGTLIHEHIIKLFDAYPPQAVEVSLYGATEKTYDSITGVAGSFKKCMQGIHRLKDHNFRLKLKTVVLNANVHELEEIETIAAELDAPFRFDAMISPRLDGDPAPVQYRVSPKEAVAKEFASPERARLYHDFFYRMNKEEPETNLYQCGAGINMFHISPQGFMRPCLMVGGASHDLLSSSFSKVWGSSDFTAFREACKAPVKCRDCDKKVICGYCPGFIQIEGGIGKAPSDYLCQLGRERKKAILNFHKEEMITC